MLRINGATALSAVNPNPPVDALPKFTERLASAKPFQMIVTQLGEVDCPAYRRLPRRGARP
jgi:hypothetical protein